MENAFAMNAKDRQGKFGSVSSSASESRTLLVVACSYAFTPNRLKEALRLLGRRCGIALRGVIVANQPEPIVQTDTDWLVVKGSNRVHDFSAYEEGLETLLGGDNDPKYVVFINDSLFKSHHPAENLRALMRQLPLLGKVEAPAIVGKVDRYSTICHRNPWSSLPLYVSTYCFALNSLAFPILLHLNKLAADDLGESDEVVSVLSPDWGRRMNLVFREFVKTFLVYGHPDFQWPGLGRYEADDKLLAIKARCIYLEHRLSGEIGKCGCILPINLRLAQRLRLDLGERMARLMRRFGLEPN